MTTTKDETQTILKSWEHARVTLNNIFPVSETHLTSVPESDTKLEFVRIYFDTSMFDKITKEILNLTDKLNSIVDLRTRQQNLWINSLLSEGRWAYSQDFL